MKEVRICDSCGFHNGLGSLFCENEACSEDISHIPPTILREKEVDSEIAEYQEKIQTQDTLGNSRQEQELYANKTIRMTGISLVNTASGFEIPIPLEGGVLGRSGTIQPDHFQNSRFVSNEHAKILLKSNGYVIVDLESTNGTKVNGTKIVSGKEYPIPTGTRVMVANLEYLVKDL